MLKFMGAATGMKVTTGKIVECTGYVPCNIDLNRDVLPFMPEHSGPLVNPADARPLKARQSCDVIWSVPERRAWKEDKIGRLGPEPKKIKLGKLEVEVAPFLRMFSPQLARCDGCSFGLSCGLGAGAHRRPSARELGLASYPLPGSRSPSREALQLRGADARDRDGYWHCRGLARPVGSGSFVDTPAARDSQRQSGPAIRKRDV